MPNISAFRGIRYDLGHVGSLSNVIAPPYDVIDAELQQQLYDKHPANVVRLILNKDEPGDDEHEQSLHARRPLLRIVAARRRALHRSRPGDLRLPPGLHRRRRRVHAPRLHVPRPARALRRRQHLPARRNARRRQGRPPQTVDRLQSEPQPDLRPLPDEENEAQEVLEAAIVGVAPLEATDHLGVIHRIWPVTDVATITARHRRHGRPARLHRRRPPPLRNRLQPPRPIRG